MGVDITVHILKYNEEDNFFHKLKLYTKEKGEYKSVLVYEGRNYDLFSALKNEKDDVEGYGHFPNSPIRMNSIEPKLREEIEKDKEYCFGFCETSLADMRYYVSQHPKVVDYDAEWDDDTFGKPFEEKPLMTNPIKYFYDDICNYIHFADWEFDFIDKLSDYKIIYYFDC